MAAPGPGTDQLGRSLVAPELPSTMQFADRVSLARPCPPIDAAIQGGDHVPAAAG